jgi:hypothetical protein
MSIKRYLDFQSASSNQVQRKLSTHPFGATDHLNTVYLFFIDELRSISMKYVTPFQNNL